MNFFEEKFESVGKCDLSKSILHGVTVSGARGFAAFVQTCTPLTDTSGLRRQYQGSTTFCKPTKGSCNSVWLKGMSTGTSSTAGTCWSTGTTRFWMLMGN